MATPVADSYSAASGVTLYVGRSGLAWAASLVPDQMTALSATTLATFVAANVPAGAYQGTNPYGAMLDAYCDPAMAPNGKQYIFGGGHGDGTCNAMIEFDETTLTYRVAAQPTPPAKYPPAYVPGSGIFRQTIYPSGASGQGGIYDPSTTPPTYSGGHFRDNLTDPADTAYNTARARASSHMYAASAVRVTASKPQGVVHYFYQTYAEFDIATGTWANVGDFPDNFQIATQLNNGTFNGRPVGQYGPVELQQGTAAHYDAVTDRFFVTLVDGDAGGGYRSSIITFNPATRNIDSVTDSSSALGFILPSTIPLQVGRKLYLFVHDAVDRGSMNTGIIFDMDTKAMQKFVLIGDTAGSQFTVNSNQETIPAWYDGIAIRRWNYTAALRNSIYSVNTTPESGTGTTADPYMLRQTARTITGTPTDGGSSSPIAYIYHRLSWNAAAGAMIFIPKSTGVPYALKLS
jgi:hypothetical protein